MLLNYDAYIFDMDEVLIDTNDSFMYAVINAVNFFQDDGQFQKNDYLKLKSISGFNNDWNLAIAGASWLMFNRELSISDYIIKLKQFGSGLNAVKQINPEVDNQYCAKITKLCMEAYGGVTQCRNLFGFDPVDIKITGFWERETPLITPNQIKPFLNYAGIFTGRSINECRLGFSILGWSIPEEYLACSDDAKLDKPNPFKLKKIIKRLSSQNPVYIGDNKDDYDLVINYRNDTNNACTFCWIGENPSINGIDLAYQNIYDFLYERKDTSD